MPMFSVVERRSALAFRDNVRNCQGDMRKMIARVGRHGTPGVRLTDLRAHFEAQLTTVRGAEECRRRVEVLRMQSRLTRRRYLRDQLIVVAQNRKTMGPLLAQIVDEAERLRFAGRSCNA